MKKPGDILDRFILKILDYSVEPTGGHTEIVYEVAGLNDQEKASLTCQRCGKTVKFIQYTRDHRAQVFLTGVCEEHAPEGYKKLKDLKTSD